MEDKFFTSSKGPRMQQCVLHCYGQLTAAARDLASGIAVRQAARNREVKPSLRSLLLLFIPGNAV
jgi:hypothetical protein